ncbi:hypothetical protein [Clostridium cylindrosporum]|nr:hypothetical protein [Clostridium cylindrosporum]
MDNSIVDLLIEKTKIAGVTSIFIGVISMICLGLEFGINYYYGFFIGILNFIFFSIGSYKLIDKGSGKAKTVQFLLFIARYVIVAIALSIAVTEFGANVFALFIGLLTINISLVISVIPVKFKKRKEV